MSQAAHLIAASHRVHVGQGEHHVSGDPSVMLSTILGSCVAACIRDDRAGVGGMNHFLLAEGSGAGADAQRYGVHAMELLINEVLKAGGERGRLRAKLFGGARMFEDLKSIGDSNAAFAQKIPARRIYSGGCIEPWRTPSTARALLAGERARADAPR